VKSRKENTRKPAKRARASEGTGIKRGVRTETLGYLSQMSGRPLSQKETDAMMKYAMAPMPRSDGISLALELGKIKRVLETSASASGRDLPTLHEFRYQIGTLTHKRAAGYLVFDPLTIRNYLQKGELTKAKGGKVSCDDKWSKKILAKYPAARVK
jgi:hypothetical protein